mmetsp:Transcript_8746/g.17604  ORF Transcript_8746/g.17604 Transcript_8746/m.17604 type:complete len:208 (+) Transcript_8746:1023-1646(+)
MRLGWHTAGSSASSTQRPEARPWRRPRQSRWGRPTRRRQRQPGPQSLRRVRASAIAAVWKRCRPRCRGVPRMVSRQERRCTRTQRGVTRRSPRLARRGKTRLGRVVVSLSCHMVSSRRLRSRARTRRCLSRFRGSRHPSRRRGRRRGRRLAGGWLTRIKSVTTSRTGSARAETSASSSTCHRDAPFVVADGRPDIDADRQTDGRIYI